MADEQSTEPVAADAIDTSSNEEAQDTEALESDLENTEISFNDFEDEDTEGEDSEDESKDDSASSKDADSDEADDSDDGGAETSKDEKPKDAVPKKEATESAEQKEKNRLAYEARQAEKAEREQAKKAAQAEYLEAAEDDKDLALRQLQIDAYNNKVESNTSKLENGIEKALSSIDLFTKGTPAVQERLLKAIDQFEESYVVKDRNGDPIELKRDIYQYLKDEAESIQKLLGEGATRQKNDKTKEKSRTFTKPSRAPKKPKVDAMMAGFDEEAGRW